MNKKDHKPKPAAGHGTAAPIKKEVKKVSEDFAFGRENYILMLVGLALIVLGFVLMTGGGRPQAAAYAGCREIDGWLFKPFDLQAISRMMEALQLPNAFASVGSAQHSHAA